MIYRPFLLRHQWLIKPLVYLMFIPIIISGIYNGIGDACYDWKELKYETDEDTEYRKGQKDNPKSDNWSDTETL